MPPNPVLVVDDDPNIVAALRELLGPLAPIISAANGSDALRVLRDQRPRVMLLDVGLPRMSGVAVLSAARRRDPTLEVIMVTGRRDVALARRALDRGARAFVTKPFDAERLRDEVRRCLERGGTGRSDNGAVAARGADCPWRVRA